MEPQPGSPNWYWNKLGYRIERLTKPIRRKIWNGTILICEGLGHDEETSLSKSIIINGGGTA